jgi:multidrug efflux pump
MAQFFIEAPHLCVGDRAVHHGDGRVAITQLPISQYPPVAPPSIVVNGAYPGASAQTLEDSVLSVIEREMNGSPGLIYMESVAQANGTGSITLSFEPGTNPDLAQVDVQNRLSRATPRLPSAVTQQGVRVDKSRSNFLLFTMLSSDDPAWTRWRWATTPRATCARTAARARRGPGPAVRHRARHAHLDRPGQAAGLQPVAADVNAAIRAQNAQVSPAKLASLPNVAGQGIAATVVVNGQLSSVEQFGNIVLRANADGSTVRLKDVARIELGAQTYATSAR